MTTVDRDASRLPLCFSCFFLENGSRSARESGQNRSNPRPRPILVVSLPSSSRGNVCTDEDGKPSGSVNGERVEKRERPIYIYNPWSTERQVVVVALLASPCVEFNAARCDAENGMGRPWRPGQWSRSEGR